MSTVTLWRLSSSAAIDDGCSRGGRWLEPGASVVVLDSSPEAALCGRMALAEVAHPDMLPRNYQLLEVIAPLDLISDLAPPLRWWSDPLACRAWGQAWFEEGASTMLVVPSASGALRVLFNWSHPHAARCLVRACGKAPFAGFIDGLRAAIEPDSAWLVS